MKEKLEWGNVRLVCPCGGDKVHTYMFDLIKTGNQIIYKCNNPDCKNSFSSDLYLKVLDLLEHWYDDHGTYDKFTAHFRVKQESIRLRYIETLQTTPTHKTLVIEIANLTRQPEARDAYQRKKDTNE